MEDVFCDLSGLPRTRKMPAMVLWFNSFNTPMRWKQQCAISQNRARCRVAKGAHSGEASTDTPKDLLPETLVLGPILSPKNSTAEPLRRASPSSVLSACSRRCEFSDFACNQIHSVFIFLLHVSTEAISGPQWI